MKVEVLPSSGSAATGAITDRVKTFEDACKVVGIENDAKFTLNTDSEYLGKHLNSVAAYTKLIIIAAALNEGWEPDFSDSNQPKYYPWLKWDPAGSGFSFSDFSYGRTHTAVGARLCFKSRELAEYAAKQFKDIYNEFLTLKTA